MKQKRKSYYNIKWHAFSKTVKRRDFNKCLRCGRTEPQVVLQVHHKVYKPDFEPWDYPLCDCLTLCKGCHAREHKLIEPNSGWTLITINDLEDLDGICERKGCNMEIRYEHITYHPQWGYLSVGSTCIEHLTQKDQSISKEVLSIFRKASVFVKTSKWEHDVTQNGNEFLYTKYAHSIIRIYGNVNCYCFQIVLKRKGEKWYDYKKSIKAHDKNLDKVKELGYLVLKGLTTEKESEKELLRNIYKRII